MLYFRLDRNSSARFPQNATLARCALALGRVPFGDSGGILSTIRRVIVEFERPACSLGAPTPRLPCRAGATHMALSLNSRRSRHCSSALKPRSLVPIPLSRIAERRRNLRNRTASKHSKVAARTTTTWLLCARGSRWVSVKGRAAGRRRTLAEAGMPTHAARHLAASGRRDSSAVLLDESVSPHQAITLLQRLEPHDRCCSSACAQPGVMWTSYDNSRIRHFRSLFHSAPSNPALKRLSALSKARF